MLDTQMLMNFVFIPIAFISLVLIIPPCLLFKITSSIIRSVNAENVAGKVVLITGASSGIGEYIAYAYGKRGARLVLAARREERLQDVSEKARRLGSLEVLVVSTDVSNSQDCERLVDKTIKHFGQLDHLVNNAGIINVANFEGAINFDFTAIMNINFWGSVYTTQFATPHLKKSKGKIVVVASCGTWWPVPGLEIYAASKAALMTFFETLRPEFGSHIGITVATLGFIQSEMSTHENISKANLNLVPFASTEGCAEAIVNGACRGERYLTYPFWARVAWFYKVIYPEIVDRICRFLFIPYPDAMKKE